MNASNRISRRELLQKKRDYSDLLVHLTRADEAFSASEVLSQILSEKKLKAYNHYCLFSPSLKESESDVLKDIASFYARELKTTIKTVTSMIEPIMIVIMGVLVGFIAMSIILPIFRMSSVVMGK